MKKLVLALVCFTFTTMVTAQSTVKNNEVKFNIGNTIAIASVEFGYERFLDDHQSLEAAILINDRINYHSESGSRKFETNSFKLGYNYYFGEENAASELYVNPFLKFRSGEFSQDEPSEEIGGKRITDMDSFILGFGVGYKWNFNDTFVVGPFVNLGRNFSDEVQDRFSAIEFNAGINIGYRF